MLHCLKQLYWYFLELKNKKEKNYEKPMEKVSHFYVDCLSAV